MKKKNLIIIICAIIIFVVSNASTYAFFTDVEEVRNTFVVGNIKITLDEANVNDLGEIIDEKRVKENEYHLMPGYTYLKDPTVTILEGSVDSYVRILVSINNLSNLIEIYGEEFSLNNIYDNFNENWIFYKENIVDNNVIYEYRYKNVVNGLNGEIKLEPLFDTFKIAPDITSSELEKISNLEVEIFAQAMQTEGFQDEIMAWKSFSNY